MSTLTIILARSIHITITPQRWLAVLLCLLAALLMWGYVAVLERGVERGERMRAEQLRVATQPPAPKAPVGVAAEKAPAGVAAAKVPARVVTAKATSAEP